MGKKENKSYAAVSEWVKVPEIPMQWHRKVGGMGRDSHLPHQHTHLERLLKPAISNKHLCSLYYIV